MYKQFTDEDGWDCVPELKEVVEIIEEMDNDIYEIKNCVRESNIYDIVNRMIDTMQEAIEELETIDLDNEWITKIED
jgi:hypothetical protein